MTTKPTRQGAYRASGIARVANIAATALLTLAWLIPGAAAQDLPGDDCDTIGGGEGELTKLSYSTSDVAGIMEGCLADTSYMHGWYLNDESKEWGVYEDYNGGGPFCYIEDEFDRDWVEITWTTVAGETVEYVEADGTCGEGDQHYFSVWLGAEVATEALDAFCESLLIGCDDQSDDAQDHE